MLQGRVILLDTNGEKPFIVTDTVSFASLLKTTVACLPAVRTHESDVIVSALASCRLVCNIRDVSISEVQNFYVASLPMEPTVKWVGVLSICLSTAVLAEFLITLLTDAIEFV